CLLWSACVTWSALRQPTLGLPRFRSVLCMRGVSCLTRCSATVGVDHRRRTLVRVGDIPRPDRARPSRPYEPVRPEHRVRHPSPLCCWRASDSRAVIAGRSSPHNARPSAAECTAGRITTARPPRDHHLRLSDGAAATNVVPRSTPRLYPNGVPRDRTAEQGDHYARLVARAGMVAAYLPARLARFQMRSVVSLLAEMAMGWPSSVVVATPNT